jgi:hypothetical protein
VGREWETSSSLERATGGEFIGGEKARLISSMEVKNPPEQILRKKKYVPTAGCTRFGGGSGVPVTLPHDTGQISYSPRTSIFSLVLLGAHGTVAEFSQCTTKKHRGTSIAREK